MRKRDNHVQVRLTAKEIQHLKKLVKKSGLSQEAYLRHLIAGLVPQETPPPDYYAMMRELHRIGINLNQIAREAHMLGFVEAGRYEENAKDVQQAIIDISGAVLLPRKME